MRTGRRWRICAGRDSGAIEMYGTEAGFDGDVGSAGTDAAVNGGMLGGAGDGDGKVRRNAAHAGMGVEIGVEAVGQAEPDVAEAGGKTPIIGNARAGVGLSVDGAEARFENERIEMAFDGHIAEAGISMEAALICIEANVAKASAEAKLGLEWISEDVAEAGFEIEMRTGGDLQVDLNFVDVPVEEGVIFVRRADAHVEALGILRIGDGDFGGVDAPAFRGDDGANRVCRALSNVDAATVGDEMKFRGCGNGPGLGPLVIGLRIVGGSGANG
jgi:hypothetical protein